MYNSSSWPLASNFTSESKQLMSLCTVTFAFYYLIEGGLISLFDIVGFWFDDSNLKIFKQFLRIYWIRKKNMVANVTNIVIKV